ncbi:ComF family protein [Candidatus Wolfebacteria bacterium]|nr:ComF family protein [Candidatus Wolfebacteria bacterium]
MFFSIRKALFIFKKIKNITIDALFPPICLVCHQYLKNQNIICDDCLSLIKINNTLFCPICRARLPENKKICHYQSKYFLASATSYNNLIIQNIIHSYKYKGFKNLAPILGEILLKYIKNSNLINQLNDWLIIPIPLHPHKEKLRGFNQSKLLAEIICKNLNLKLVDGLKRIKNNKPQMKIKGIEARNKNIIGCFEIKNPDIVKNKNVVLVDDVFTSGATANEAVKILKINGAQKLIVLTLTNA